eukprot:6774061-Alexandrium_andersonii.AAC.1
MPWAKRNLKPGPMFGPRDLPKFGALLNSGALLRCASSSPNGLYVSWGSLDTKVTDLDEATGAILAMEN